MTEVLSAMAELNGYKFHYRGCHDTVHVYRNRVSGQPLADFDGTHWAVGGPIPQDVLEAAEDYWRGFDE